MRSDQSDFPHSDPSKPGGFGESDLVKRSEGQVAAELKETERPGGESLAPGSKSSVRSAYSAYRPISLSAQLQRLEEIGRGVPRGSSGADSRLSVSADDPWQALEQRFKAAQDRLNQEFDQLEQRQRSLDQAQAEAVTKDSAAPLIRPRSSFGTAENWVEQYRETQRLREVASQARARAIQDLARLQAEKEAAELRAAQEARKAAAAAEALAQAQAEAEGLRARQNQAAEQENQRQLSELVQAEAEEAKRLAQSLQAFETGGTDLQLDSEKVGPGKDASSGPEASNVAEATKSAPTLPITKQPAVTDGQLAQASDQLSPSAAQSQQPSAEGIGVQLAHQGQTEVQPAPARGTDNQLLPVSATQTHNIDRLDLQLEELDPKLLALLFSQADAQSIKLNKPTTPTLPDEAPSGSAETSSDSAELSQPQVKPEAAKEKVGGIAETSQESLSAATPGEKPKDTPLPPDAAGQSVLAAADPKPVPSKTDTAQESAPAPPGLAPAPPPPSEDEQLSFERSKTYAQETKNGKFSAVKSEDAFILSESSQDFPGTTDFEISESTSVGYENRSRSRTKNVSPESAGPKTKSRPRPVQVAGGNSQTAPSGWKNLVRWLVRLSVLLLIALGLVLAFDRPVISNSDAPLSDIPGSLVEAVFS